MAAESFKIYSLQNDGTRIPAMVSAGQTSAEGNTSSSSVKEMTATELTAIDIVARKAMYEDGIRLIQVYNNNTIVLLSLDANGKTSWAGGYQPKNLLNNSDFTNPVNQRNQTGYSGVGYTIDRWRLWESDYTLTVNDDSITVNGVLWQYIEGEDGRTFSFFYGNDTEAIQSHVGYDDVMGCYYVTIPTGTWTWAALYEGEYTAETLPPYVPKGYAAELAECQRYFVAIKAFPGYSTPICEGYMANTNTGRALIHLPVPMRATPSLSYYNVTETQMRTGGKEYIGASATVLGKTENGVVLHCVLPSGQSTSSFYTFSFCIANPSGGVAYLSLSADL